MSVPGSRRPDPGGLGGRGDTQHVFLLLGEFINPTPLKSSLVRGVRFGVKVGQINPKLDKYGIFFSSDFD